MLHISHMNVKPLLLKHVESNHITADLGDMNPLSRFRSWTAHLTLWYPLTPLDSLSANYLLNTSKKNNEMNPRTKLNVALS